MIYQQMLNSRILKFENEIDGFFNSTHPSKKIIDEAMLYSLKAGGKRIRPLLFLAFNEAYGGRYEDGLPFAMALEMIHTYSLIHDDLPCMDNDDLRRGKPTNHIVYGEGLAVLAGDGLLNLACEIMVDASIKNKNALPVAAKIIKSAGTEGMILGQVADIQNDDKKVTKEMLDFINANKTGKLLSAAIVGGAMLGGAESEHINKLEEVAYNVGLMFQMADDLLDLLGDPDKIGKQTQMDEKNNKTTYPMLMGIEETKETINLYKANVLTALKTLKIEDDFIIKTIEFLTQRDY